MFLPVYGLTTWISPVAQAVSRSGVALFQRPVQIDGDNKGIGYGAFGMGCRPGIERLLIIPVAVVLRLPETAGVGVIIQGAVGIRKGLHTDKDGIFADVLIGLGPVEDPDGFAVVDNVLFDLGPPAQVDHIAAAGGGIGG